MAQDSESEVKHWLTSHKRHLWRAFWAVMLVLHVPASLKVASSIWSPEGGPLRLPSLLLLTVCNAFFVVEIAFAFTPRLISNRRAAMVFVLIVLFLHAGVIDRHLPDALPDWSLVAWSPVATAACLALLLTFAPSRLIRIAQALAAEACRQRIGGRYGTLQPGFLPLRSQLRLGCFCTRRGPPMLQF